MLQFIQDAASKYMHGGHTGQQQGSGAGDLDWSHLSGLAQQFGKADSNTQGELEPSTFKKLCALP